MSFLSVARALLTTTLRASEAAMTAEENGYRADAERLRRQAASAANCASKALDSYMFEAGDFDSEAGRTLALAATFWEPPGA